MALPTGAPAQTFTKWYLAEGATGGGANFIEDILIANPGAVDAQVRITFLPAGGTSVPPYELTVKATSRASVRVNAIPGLSSLDSSAIVESLNGVDIVVERSMYWPAPTRQGGHNSTGVLGPATRWFLAEGSTGYFNTFVLIGNPDPTRTARVKVTFLKPGGGTVVYKRNGVDETFLVPASTRTNVWPNAEVAELSGGQAFSTVVESVPNGSDETVGVIAERAMYWDNPGPLGGGHGSAGVTQAASTWLFAEGTTKAVPGLAFDTFLLLSNPNALPTRARVRFFTSPGTPPLERFYTLAPHSRENVWANVIPELQLTDFSIKVESVDTAEGDPAQPIVAERAVYWGPPTGPPVPNWVDGHNTPGVTAEAKKWVFAEGLEDRFADAGDLNFDTYFLISNTQATPLDLRVTFVREDGTGIVREFRTSTGTAVGAESRFTIAGFQFPELTNQRFAAFFESLNDQSFVVERAVYWGQGYFGGHASTGVPWTGDIGVPPPPPEHTVTQISPAKGPTTGGTPVTITGIDFASGATLVIGGIAASNVLVLNSTAITAVTGPRPAASNTVVDVVVRSNGIDKTLAAAFTYEVPKDPAITGVSPNVGPSSGSTAVAIAGQNFNPSSVIVSFGGTGAGVSSATSTLLNVVTPPRAIPQDRTTLAVDVVVNTNGKTATLAGGFTYRTFTPTDVVLAFGDSITFGLTDCVFDVMTFIRTCTPGDGGYPIRLKQEMESRYPAQVGTINVQNQGEPQEDTFGGKARLPGTLTPAQDLVIILEGVNAIDETGIGTIATNLRQMVQTAKGAGKWVILCTLTPVVATAYNPDPMRVAALNEEIVKIAGQEGVLLADTFAAVSENLGAYLSADGLHPTNAGYRRMAEYLINVIRLNFETTPPPK